MPSNLMVVVQPVGGDSVRAMAWSVQARWTVGDVERSYEPVIVRTKWGARRMAASMRRTLSHFPTLNVVIEEADTASIGRTAVQPEPGEVHLADSPSAAQTACGVPVEGLPALCYDVDLFRGMAQCCPSCLHASGS
jgi:hypothetical protein